MELFLRLYRICLNNRESLENRVVLQKHEAADKEQKLYRSSVPLESHSEQFSDESCPAQAVSLVYSLHLSFSDHVHCLISLQCSPSRFK